MYLVDIYESRSSYYNKNCYYNALAQDIHSGYALTQNIHKFYLLILYYLFYLVYSQAKVKALCQPFSS